MSEYIGMVLVKFPESTKNYLFRAPRWDDFEPGDEVIVETRKGEKKAEVVMGYDSIDQKSKEFEFIVKACGATLPLKKVLKRVEYTDMEYTEVQEDGEED